MPLVLTVDYETKKIYLGPDSAGIELDTMDIYREVRARRRLNEADRRWRPMIISGGNIVKNEVSNTLPYVQLLHGCEIIPWDVTQTLTLIRDTFTDDGRAGAEVFNTTGFTNVVTLVEAVDKEEIVKVSVGPSNDELLVEVAENQKRLLSVYGMNPGHSYKMPPSSGGEVLEDGVPVADVAGDCENGFTVTSRP